MDSQVEIFHPENELISLWHSAVDLDVQAGDLAKDTGVTYQNGLRVFLEWVRATRTAQITGGTIQAWKADRLTHGYAPKSVNVWYAGVKRFYSWAVPAGLLAADPTIGVKNVKRHGSNKKHLRDALTDREVLRVLDQPDRSTMVGKRDAAILCLLAFCALREIEITRADLADLRTVDGVPVLRVQGKGSHEKDETAVIYSATAQDALYDWLAVRGSQAGPLFVSLSRRSAIGSRMSTRAVRDLVRYLRSAGVLSPRTSLHSLRHSAISKVARHDLLKAKQVARHSSIDTTMIYVHEADRFDNPGEQFISYSNGGE